MLGKPEGDGRSGGDTGRVRKWWLRHIRTLPPSRKRWPDRISLNGSQLGREWRAFNGGGHKSRTFRYLPEIFSDDVKVDKARTDAATVGRARIFAFSHVFGPFLGHAITTYLYYTDKNRELPFWVIVALSLTCETVP